MRTARWRQVGFMGTDSGKPSNRASPEIESIDLGWDDDASGEIPLAGLHSVPNLETEFDRVTAIPDEPSAEYVRQAMQQVQEPEEKSGVQPIGERPARPGAHAAAAAHGHEVPALDIDEPMHERGTYDELSLDLESGKAPDPVQLGMSAGNFELDLETPIAPPVEEPAVSQMRDRYAAGDFTGALVLAESLLEAEPNHADALRFAESCRDVLMQMYAARLGALDQPVRVAIPPDQVRWLSLDHRAGFLLSLVDGSSTVDEILDISGMPRLDALRIMYTLFEQRIVALGPDVPAR